MSIEERLQWLLGERRLFLRPSSFLSISARNVYLVPGIEACTHRPFADTLEGERYAELAAYLDAFSELNMITVCQNPRHKPPDVMLARVSNAAEFWSMRITAPENTPGMRLLGAFSACDSFVGLLCDFRENMDFDDEVARTEKAWRDLFGTIPPLSGRTLDDYITNCIER